MYAQGSFLAKLRRLKRGLMRYAAFRVNKREALWKFKSPGRVGWSDNSSLFLLKIILPNRLNHPYP